MVIRPHTASSAIFSASRSGTTRPVGKFSLRAFQRMRPIRQAPNSRPGNTPAMKRAAMDTVPPVAIE